MIFVTSQSNPEWMQAFRKSNFFAADVVGDNLLPQVKVGESHFDGLAAGFLAGVISRTATAPAERVKTQMQLAQTKQSITSIIRTVHATGGAKAFFQGNLINCLKVGPQSAFHLFATDYLKHSLPTSKDPEWAQVNSFCAGTIAGLGGQFLIYPLEPMKTMMTVAEKGTYSGAGGVLKCARECFEQGKLFRGLGPTLAGVVPYAGTQRWMYDVMWTQYTERAGTDKPNAAVGFGIGLISSLVAQTLSYPLMLARTRMQMSDAYSGAWDCLKKTAKQEGIGATFKGLFPNLAKSAPAAAINIALYEPIKNQLSIIRSNRATGS